MSCTAHVFSCLSLRLRAAFFYLDYASISYYGFGSTVAYYYYLLPGLSLLDARVMTPYVQQRLGWHVDCTHLIAAYRALVLPVAFVLAVACTVACCKSRTDWCAYPFALRTFVFVMPLSMACPIMLESWLFDLRGENPTLFVHFYRRYFWLVVAAFFNVSKIPERIQPGLFDIIGHSHQLFHIFTFLSIYDQVYYVEEGLRQFLQAPPAAPTFSGTVGYMLLLVVCLGLVIRRFLNNSEFCSKKVEKKILHAITTWTRKRLFVFQGWGEDSVAPFLFLFFVFFYQHKACGSSELSSFQLSPRPFLPPLKPSLSTNPALKTRVTKRSLCVFRPSPTICLRRVIHF
ncbi:progestin and adipoQ receptor family member 9 [Carlito syrichta]|uniref:Progestin and adipoQ receptor family member 9 n=1 Tax=Carlito syrichta TaxID=1868482 RepID=A0A1U7UKL9_CARSF|nr:progestin and adipoQ receptor family member 9 [Carlito syrichta]